MTTILEFLAGFAAALVACVFVKRIHQKLRAEREHRSSLGHLYTHFFRGSGVAMNGTLKVAEFPVQEIEFSFEPEREPFWKRIAGVFRRRRRPMPPEVPLTGTITLQVDSSGFDALLDTLEKESARARLSKEIQARVDHAFMNRQRGGRGDIC